MEQHSKAYCPKTVVYVLLRLAGTARNNKVTTQSQKHAFHNEHNEFRGTLWEGGVEWTRSDYVDQTYNTEHGYASIADTQKINATLLQEG